MSLIEFLKDKKICILGYGKQGKSTFKYLRKHFPNKKITIADKNENIDKKELDENVYFKLGDSYLKDIENCQTVKDSYEVAYKQFLDTLKKIGMEEIEAIRKTFNPNEHEAITQVPTNEFEPDTIAYVAQKGYKLDDRVIRPALVGVAKKLEDE